MHREGIPEACFWPIGYYIEIWDSTAGLFKPPTKFCYQKLTFCKSCNHAGNHAVWTCT